MLKGTDYKKNETCMISAEHKRRYLVKTNCPYNECRVFYCRDKSVYHKFLPNCLDDVHVMYLKTRFSPSLSKAYCTVKYKKNKEEEKKGY